MALFMVSPGVEIREIDLTAIIPSVSTAIGALCGDFTWGPVDEITSVTNKDVLYKTFGKPTDDNFGYFFHAQTYLAYSNNLRVIRNAQTGALNAVANGSASPNAVNIKNDVDFENQSFTADDGTFAAKFPGVIGNSLMITYCLADSAAFNNWQDDDNIYKNYFSSVPGTSEFCEKFGVYNDEMHIMIIDQDGMFTGAPGTILERYEYLSMCPDAKFSDGTSSYFVNVLHARSKYVRWIANDDNFAACNAGQTIDWIKLNVTPSGSPARLYYYDPNYAGSPAISTANYYEFIDGSVGTSSGVDELMDSYDKFADATAVDVTLLIAGVMPDSFADSITYANYLVALAERRHDAIALVSPPTFGPTGSVYYTNPTDAITFTNELISSSFGVIDSCAIKVYDQYSGVYRWIAANSTIAGLCANTDNVADPWWSPAGYNRGQLKNITKISYNPGQMDRDDLYKARINPIVQFPGQGTILYGDKTLLARPSAFDRINVRRLFNVLEKAISTYAKYILFEFNDEFTRSRFVNLVDPYLREVKGRRGIYEYLVRCDETNNPPVVIDANEFIADIFIQPARSINFIRLNFIATPTGVDFQEIITGMSNGTL